MIDNDPVWSLSSYKNDIIQVRLIIVMLKKYCHYVTGSEQWALRKVVDSSG